MDPAGKMPVKRKHYSKAVLKAGLAQRKARAAEEAERSTPLKKRKTMSTVIQEQEGRKELDAQKERERSKSKANLSERLLKLQTESRKEQDIDTERKDKAQGQQKGIQKGRKQDTEPQKKEKQMTERSEFSHKYGKQSNKSQRVTTVKERKPNEESKCINKEEADWYVTQITQAAENIKQELLEDKNLKELIRQFLDVIHDCMKELKLQVDTTSKNKEAISSTVIDYVGTAWRAWLHGQPVMPSNTWKELIELKFDTQVTEEDKIMEQLEEAFYPRNAQTLEEEQELKREIENVFQHLAQAHMHSSKAAAGLAGLAKKVKKVDDYYMILSVATTPVIQMYSPIVDRLMDIRKKHKDREAELIKQKPVEQLVAETCLPCMKEEWKADMYRPVRQLAATCTFFMRKTMFNEANVEKIAKEFEISRPYLYKLTSGRKFLGGKK